MVGFRRFHLGWTHRMVYYTHYESRPSFSLLPYGSFRFLSLSMRTRIITCIPRWPRDKLVPKLNLETLIIISTQVRLKYSGQLKKYCHFHIYTTLTSAMSPPTKIWYLAIPWTRLIKINLSLKFRAHILVSTMALCQNVWNMV